MNDDSDLPRWRQGDADTPLELSRLMRLGCADVGSIDEVTELARRLSVALGPAAGLASGGGSVPEPGAAGQPLEPPASGPRPSADVGAGAARAGSKLSGSAARWVAWIIGGTSAIAGVWWAVGDRASAPREPAALVDARSAVIGEPPIEPPIEAPGVPPRAPELPRAPAPEPSTASSDLSMAPPPEPRTQERPRSSPPARGPRPGGEAQLLERAQAALVRRPAEALRLTREHEARFPRGVLVQEREVIAIEALERLGRVGAAKARAAAFEHRFRGSVHHPRVRRTTDTSAPPGGSPATLPQ
jgi:hypothetical protein